MTMVGRIDSYLHILGRDFPLDMTFLISIEVIHRAYLVFHGKSDVSVNANDFVASSLS